MPLNEEKKKIVYIGLIIFCLVTTGAIVFMNMGGGGGSEVELQPAVSDPTKSPATTAPATTVPTSSIAAQIKMMSDANYPPASVFPAQKQFDVSLFKSQKFLSLTSQELPMPQPEEFGVTENPFHSILKKK